MKQHCNVYDAIIVGGGHNGLVAASYLAKAGKTVLLLEAHDELGGATTSVKPFPEYDARLSRYSYLVSLLPDQIVTDLGINFKTLGRAVASYTPYHRNGQDDGLFISTDWDEATASSFRRLTGSDREGKAWREFYDEIAQLAQRFAPSMLQPLKCAAQLKAERSNCNQRWPRLKSGVDPRLAFAGTFHVNESFSQLEAACAETDDPHIYLAGAGARRGGGVSGIAGHNAAMALLGKS